MFSIYQLKGHFQLLLRPLVSRLAAAGIRANAITLLAAGLSCTLGLALFLTPTPAAFLLLPPFMFVRMAMNAIDGMLALEFGQRSALGAYLNELADVVSDAALYLPFVLVTPFGWGSVGAVVFLSALSEMAGVLATAVGARRRYDGPLGKSDRAAVFGALALWYRLAGSLPTWSYWILPLMAAAIALSVVNRVRGGLRDSAMQGEISQ